MTTTSQTPQALLAAPKVARPPASEMIVRLSRDFGVKPLQQMREMASLRFGPGKLASHEYISTGAFRPEFDATAKREFVGRTGSYELNIAASPEQLTVSRGFMRDKVLYTHLIQSLGLPTTQTQAVAHKTRNFGDLTTLREAPDVADFLRNQATYPLFGKPVEGAASVGSVLIRDINAGTGQLALGNGQNVDVEQFAQEVVSQYPEGFLLQSAIQQHDVLRSVTGDAVGTLRVVTLRDANGIEPLYTLWKIPSPTAMSDNFWQDGSMVALIDDAGGIVSCAQGTGPDHSYVERHPVSDVAFADITIPHMNDLFRVATQAHQVFPEFGVIGWDIAMGTEGPIIIEANDNPFHALYQLVAGKGARHPEMLARFDAAAAESQRILKNKIALFQGRKSATR